MASDQEIAEGLNALFRETNPNSFTSLNDVILRLQSKLGVDLSQKIDFIRAQITLLFSSAPPPPPPSSALLPRPPPINPSLNPNPNPNPPSYHVFHHPHPSAHSHFAGSFVSGPRGPTEISFAQPGGVVAAETHSSAPVKERLCFVSLLLLTSAFID